MVVPNSEGAALAVPGTCSHHFFGHPSAPRSHSRTVSSLPAPRARSLASDEHCGAAVFNSGDVLEVFIGPVQHATDDPVRPPLRTALGAALLDH